VILEAPTFAQLFRPVEPERKARIPKPAKKGPRGKTATGKPRLRRKSKGVPGKAQPDLVAKGRALWDEGKSIAKIAAAVGMSYAAVYGWKGRHQWPAQKKSATTPAAVPGVPKRPFV
jgi:hypothetical protein